MKSRNAYSVSYTYMFFHIAMFIYTQKPVSFYWWRAFYNNTLLNEIRSSHKYWLFYYIYVVLPYNKIHSFNIPDDHQEQNNIMRNDKEHPTLRLLMLHHHPIMSSLILSCEHNSTSTSTFLSFPCLCHAYRISHT